MMIEPVTGNDVLSYSLAPMALCGALGHVAAKLGLGSLNGSRDLDRGH